MRSVTRRAGVLCGVGAVAWSALFAVFHLLWSLGWRGFLGSGPQVDAAFERPAFALYNDVVALACVLGVLVAVLLVLGERVRPGLRRLAWFGAVAACVLLALRGGIGVVQGLFGAAPPPSQRAAYDFDPWFLFGAVLFGLTAWFARSGRATPPSPR